MTTNRRELTAPMPRREFLSRATGLAATGVAATGLTGRGFLAGRLVAGGVAASSVLGGSAPALPGSRDLRAAEPRTPGKAQIAITLDLEMSRDYPRRGMTEWDYEKGNLDEATKRYAVEAARRVAERGGRIHFFCVGRVLEQPDVGWLRELAEAGHAIGNHTYDHVNLLAKTPEETQFRFRRAPWLVQGKSTAEVLWENIAVTSRALKQRAGIDVRGFRSPGGFAQGLDGREDLQAMLLELGFRWVSTMYPAHQSGEPRQPPTEDVYQDIVRAQRHAQPRVYPSGLVEIPMSPISDVTAMRSHYWKREYFLEAIRRAVGWAIERRAVFDFLAHPSCLVVEDPEFESIQLLCDLVAEAPERAELVTLDAIAERVRAPVQP